MGFVDALDWWQRKMVDCHDVALQREVVKTGCNID
jgi:hypothetical protein